MLNVHFSPNGGCLSCLLKSIDQAQKEILVQAYAFGSLPISTALIAAQTRGVDVKIILDKKATEERGSLCHTLGQHLKVWIDGAHAIAHNKVMIIDQALLYTGSYNFTRAAEFSNAENLLELDDKTMIQAYTANWYHHQSHSDPYVKDGEEGAKVEIAQQEPEEEKPEA